METPNLSLVAEVDGQLAGHVMFSPLYIDSPSGEVISIQLGPLAVLPELQRQGIGSALVEGGIAACRLLGYDYVFVLGHRTYYPRFGFRPARHRGIIFQDGRDSFMVLELRPGALEGLSGNVRYGPEFDAAFSQA